MKNINLIIVLLLSFGYVKINFAQEKNEFSRIEITNSFINQKSEFNNSSDLNDKVIHNKNAKDGTKSPFLGALLSGVIPGAGEFYAKSFIKSA